MPINNKQCPADITGEVLSRYPVRYLYEVALQAQQSLHEDEEYMLLFNLQNKRMCFVRSDAYCTEEDVPLYVFGKYSDLSELTEESITNNIELFFILS